MPAAVVSRSAASLYLLLVAPLFAAIPFDASFTRMPRCLRHVCLIEVGVSLPPRSSRPAYRRSRSFRYHRFFTFTPLISFTSLLLPSSYLLNAYAVTPLLLFTTLVADYARFSDDTLWLPRLLRRLWRAISVYGDVISLLRRHTLMLPFSLLSFFS